MHLGTRCVSQGHLNKNKTTESLLIIQSLDTLQLLLQLNMAKKEKKACKGLDHLDPHAEVEDDLRPTSS